MARIDGLKSEITILKILLFIFLIALFITSFLGREQEKDLKNLELENKQLKECIKAMENNLKSVTINYKLEKNR